MSKKTKRVLIVSYFYPPSNTIGALRVGKFSKYLPEFGWESLVLTPNGLEDTSLSTDLYSSPMYRGDRIKQSKHISKRALRSYWKSSGAEKNDASVVMREIKEKLMSGVRRISSLPIVRLVLRDNLRWILPAVFIGRDAINKHEVDVIFSSYAPASSHIVASMIHKMTGVPWVADFRDLWSNSTYVEKIEPLSSIEESFEKMIICGSTTLTTISDPLAEDLNGLHGKEVVAITNGFDVADYSREISPAQKFTITYTGEIYAGKRNPTPLFEAISRLRTEKKISPENFEVRFFGSSVQRAIGPLLDAYGLQELVKTSGRIPLAESIDRQMESTVLLLLSWNDPRERGVLTGKVFEYLGAKRPILAVGLRGGTLDRLLTASGSGIMMNDSQEIADILSIWLDEFYNLGEIRTYFLPRAEFIEQFTRREKARELAKVLDDALM